MFSQPYKDIKTRSGVGLQSAVQPLRQTANRMPFAVHVGSRPQPTGQLKVSGTNVRSPVELRSKIDWSPTGQLEARCLLEPIV